jgi:hypothetical protein
LILGTATNVIVRRSRSASGEPDVPSHFRMRSNAVVPVFSLPWISLVTRKTFSPVPTVAVWINRPRFDFPATSTATRPWLMRSMRASSRRISP